jgi:hypothetical protein
MSGFQAIANRENVIFSALCHLDFHMHLYHTMSETCDITIEIIKINPLFSNHQK